MMGGMTPIVRNLLIINVIMFVITAVMPLAIGGVELYRLLAFHYYESDYFRPHQLITYMFLHGGFGHIFFNMFAVFMFGKVLEQVWGPKRFLIFYMVTGIGAGIIHMGYTAFEMYRIADDVAVFAASGNADSFLSIAKDHFAGIYDPTYVSQVYDGLSAGQFGAEAEAMEGIREWTEYKMDIPTVGASGAVFGLLLAFGMLFPNTPLMLIFLPIPIKAKYFVMLYAGFELFMGIQDRPGDNVAHFAHLGGALFGFILVKLWSRDRANFY